MAKQIIEKFRILGNGASIEGDNIEPQAKKYIARLEQVGTDAPTATIIFNSLSDVPVWTRDDAGVYILTLADEFTSGKTSINVYTQDNSLGALSSEKVFGTGSDNENSIYLLTGLRNAAGARTQVDNVMIGTTWIEINVYP